MNISMTDKLRSRWLTTPNRNFYFQVPQPYFNWTKSLISIWSIYKGKLSNNPCTPPRATWKQANFRKLDAVLGLVLMQTEIGFPGITINYALA